MLLHIELHLPTGRLVAVDHDEVWFIPYLGNGRIGWGMYGHNCIPHDSMCGVFSTNPRIKEEALCHSPPNLLPYSWLVDSSSSLMPAPVPHIPLSDQMDALLSVLSAATPTETVQHSVSDDANETV
jgi:hypothetical protein